MDFGTYSISIFFPAFNDAGSIGDLIHRAAALLPKLTDEYEIVVVNDGSRDGTGRILTRLSERYPFLKVIHHGVNRGYGAALITGFANCAKDLIFYTDGDGQYDVGELPALLNAFAPGTDLVNGYKISRSDSRLRVFTGLAYLRLIKFLFRLHAKDVDCDFRLFRRSLLQHSPLTCDSGMICVEMMKRFQDRGCRMIEIPVHHYPRAHGYSQFFTLRHLGRIFTQLFTTWWRLVACPMLPHRPALPRMEVGARGLRHPF